MAILTSSSLREFVSSLVIRTKQQIIIKQGGILGHPEFVPAKKPSGLTLIDTGNMLSSITCQVEPDANGIRISATSNADYSSFVQLKSGKNWDIMEFTSEELLYYAKQIQGNVKAKRIK